MSNGLFPNLFEYSTKESTLDAMIMWFAHCLEINSSEANRIGNAFFRELIFKDRNLPENIELESAKSNLKG